MRDLMRRRGTTLAGAALLLLGLVSACAAGPAVRDDDAAAAVHRALPVLQHTMAQWFEERTCTACHHHSLGVLALSFAKERGFAVDEARLGETIERLAKSPDGTVAALQGRGAINPASGRGFQMAALAATKHPADERTDAMVHLLAGLHHHSGAWLSESHRAPLEDTAVTTTALCSLALRNYGPAGRRDEFVGRLTRARQWLLDHRATSNEERSMRLLGLHWTGAQPQAIAAAVGELIAMQRADGGWAQIDGEPSDAYATAQSLVALQQVGGMNTGDEVYRRGARLLLDTQCADGTWLVKTRRRTQGLEHFETGFPHGEDQFISCAATCWAVMALAAIVDPSPSRGFHGESMPRAKTAASLPELHTAAAFGTHSQLLRLLNDGVDPNLPGPGGLTALMLAVHDPEKVTTLLRRGARVELRSDLQNTALILAGRTSPIETMEMLLAEAADPAAHDDDGTSAITHAVIVGDIDKVDLLLRSGNAATQCTKEGVALVQFPCWQGDTAMLSKLIAAGADLNVSFEGASPLILASCDGLDAIVTVLLAAGVPVDAPDKHGMTALAWAARIRWGNARVAAALLYAGADPDKPGAEGRTPRDWARIEHNRPVLELLSSIAPIR